MRVQPLISPLAIIQYEPRRGRPEDEMYFMASIRKRDSEVLPENFCSVSSFERVVSGEKNNSHDE
jgi:hypothetical protein